MEVFHRFKIKKIKWSCHSLNSHGSITLEEQKKKKSKFISNAIENYLDGQETSMKMGIFGGIGGSCYLLS